MQEETVDADNRKLNPSMYSIPCGASCPSTDLINAEYNCKMTELPWRQSSEEEVKTDCCTRSQALRNLSLENKTISTNEAPVVNENSVCTTNWISSLTDTCLNSTTSAEQNNKLSSIHSEKECSMRHRQIAYAHHKHCLQPHTHQQICVLPRVSSISSFAGHSAISQDDTRFTDNVDQTGVVTSSGSVEPHFKDVYPHHHHHFSHVHEHGARKQLSTPLDPIIDDGDFPSHQSNILFELEHTKDTLTRDKLKHLNEPQYLPGLDIEDTELEGAWLTLKMRVWEWLEGVQDTT